MKNKQRILLVALNMLFVTVTYAQRASYNIKNGLGIGGGISTFNIKTDNFVTTKGKGYVATLSAIVDIPHRWFTVSYGMQISENTIEISGRMTDDVAGDEQISLLLLN